MFCFCVNAPQGLGQKGFSQCAPQHQDVGNIASSKVGSYTTCARASALARSPASLMPLRTADAEGPKPSLTKRYRAARVSESEDLLPFYNCKTLLSPTFEELNLWIRKGQVSVAERAGEEGESIGMIRSYFAGDESVKQRLIDQFGLSKPLQVLEAIGSKAEGHPGVQPVGTMSSNCRLDVENIELFYCSSFSVIDSERKTTTAFRLGEHSLFQFLPLLQKLKRELNCEDKVTSRSTKKQIGFLFGTSTSDTSVRRMAIHIWRRLLQIVWYEEIVKLNCIVFEHERPDGEAAHGNLLLFDV